MNYLIFGDIHVSQSSLKECKIIFKEIIDLCNKYSITHVISLGDNFNNNKPTASELNCLGEFIRGLGSRKIILLAAQSHESETVELSSVDIYGILSDNVKVVKEFKDGNHLYCGHFILSESNVNYGAKLSKEDFKNYIYCLLGHQHSYQIIKPNICHLGSSRYVSFSEANDKHKIVALITSYGEENEQIHFLSLKSPTKMVEFILNSNNSNELEEKNSKNPPKEALQDTILPKNGQVGKDTVNSNSSISQAQNPSNLSQIELLCQKLDKLDKNTKVKVKIMDFGSFRGFLPFVNKYSSKFETFKYETSFEVVSVDNQKCQSTEIKSFRESLSNYLKNNKIDPTITEILQKEIE